MIKNKKQKEIPGATICGKYNTYEDMRYRDLQTILGNVVELDLENLVKIEIGGWGTGLRLTCPKGVSIELRKTEAGGTKLFLTREK